MAITVQNIIDTALRKIGAVPAGDSASTIETADALMDLNGMLDAMNADPAAIYATESDIYPLVIGQQVYTMGPGGNFNAARAQDIRNANLINLANPAQPVRTPISMVDEDYWAAISVLNVPTPIPSVAFYSQGFPLATLSFWGVPSAANQVEIYTQQLIVQFASAAQTVVLPPPYFEYLWSHLAIRVAPDYGRPVPDAVQAVADESRRRMESTNAADTPIARADSGLMSLSGGTRSAYNWLTNR